ncbi:2-polyprenyl-6-methoxyphenol hydroxylase-like FAD-dependent oxidoreductase [Allocatelliglobosispora scoriae]|uniref:2-polyprenyl-6-methoxyphenol hydroxylase-like FAD-dependent oxidoreductase n=1 Tax=Allocatelliglobosispora scoriae TaxID=643052 RepID=A0A841C142_9ACTN|nr:FAD-dependent monooxygenase [Allocatelliglobosispora scoriae]MBB5873586.1 2-polyprenyl-6-methoxyphenol hydroxylase-like FAD-dependent oxidoreductase [Allocatelliglobosispora scoriae]
MRQQSVLISGASITGPALAHWLHRYGFATTIVEVGPALRPGGHAVDIRGVARRVVEEMGLLPAIRAAGVHERGYALVNGAGRITGAVPADAFGGGGIVAEIEIMRGDLSEILYQATRDGTEYLFGDRIAELAEGTDGVEVTFGSGLVRSFDFVIGADGVHSGVRRLAFGPQARFVTHLGAYTGYFTVPDPGNLDDWFLMYNAPGGLVASLRPERGGTAKASLSFRSPELAYDRHDVQAQKEILAERHARSRWLVPQLLDAVWEAPDFYFDSISQVRVDRWSRGRITLAGDAGYCGSPLSGLGTSLSLVGGYVLAGELASTPDDHEGAFARYQDEMRGYVEQCMELPPGGISGYAPNSQLMISLRNISMGMVNHWPMRQIMAKQAGKADAITLKAYPA